MMEIETPRITLEESADSRSGKFIVEPLERGYGITLGNALRRVSSRSTPRQRRATAPHTSVPLRRLYHDLCMRDLCRP